MADMERAYTTPESPDDPPGVKAARELALKDYPKFLATYVKLKDGKAGEVEAPAAAATNGFVEVGPKEEAVEELAEKLLAEWEASGG